MCRGAKGGAVSVTPLVAVEKLATGEVVVRLLNEEGESLWHRIVVALLVVGVRVTEEPLPRVP